MRIRLSVSAALAACAPLLVWAATASADAVVVVSAQSPVSQLTAEQAAEIFLGRLTTLPGGLVLAPVDQAEGSALRVEFHAKVTRKSPPVLKAYWAKLLFTGRGQPPREAADDAAVKKLVAGNPGAIGYIDAASVDSTVKVVLSVKP